MENQKKDNKIDVYDDELMVNIGIRPPHLINRDSSVWTKTIKEKKALKIARKSIKNKFSRGIKEKKYIPFYDKLIITITKNPNFVCYDKSGNKHYQTTISHICNINDISNIIKFFGIENVIKYYWNGKTYSPREIPFWNW